jgi:hypothetical protein
VEGLEWGVGRGLLGVLELVGFLDFRPCFLPLEVVLGSSPVGNVEDILGAPGASTNSVSCERVAPFEQLELELEWDRE